MGEGGREEDREGRMQKIKRRGEEKLFSLAICIL